MKFVPSIKDHLSQGIFSSLFLSLSLSKHSSKLLKNLNFPSGKNSQKPLMYSPISQELEGEASGVVVGRIAANSKVIFFIAYVNQSVYIDVNLWLCWVFLYKYMNKNQLHLRAKSLLQKLFQMIQVTVPIFFYFDVISKIWPLEPKNTYFWPFSKKEVKMAVFWL